jgi:hypothetical protein
MNSAQLHAKVLRDTQRERGLQSEASKRAESEDPECYDTMTKIGEGILGGGENETDFDTFNRLSSFLKNLEELRGGPIDAEIGEINTESKKILTCLAKNILKILQNEGSHGGKTRNRRNKNKRTKRNKY